jgi:hypothetical protein
MSSCRWHRSRKRASGAEFVPFKLCGSLFDEHPQLVITCWLRSVFELRKSRRLSRAESLRYPLPHQPMRYRKNRTAMSATSVPSMKTATTTF